MSHTLNLDISSLTPVERARLRRWAARINEYQYDLVSLAFERPARFVITAADEYDLAGGGGPEMWRRHAMVATGRTF